MKKILIMLLLATTCMMFVGCGSTNTDTATEESKEPEVGSPEYIFNLSKDAYLNIQNAYEIIDVIGSDVYEAWRVGTSGSSDKYSSEKLAEDILLSKQELQDGLMHHFEEDLLKEADGEETLKSLKENVEKDDTFLDTFFYVLMGEGNASTFDCNVNAVIYAYEAKGSFDEIQKYLGDAKTTMKELSADYSDYEHYPALKEYYTTVSAYADFLQNPEGSFQQLKDTINDYTNDARAAKNDLDFVFED